MVPPPESGPKLEAELGLCEGAALGCTGRRVLDELLGRPGALDGGSDGPRLGDIDGDAVG